MRRILVIGCPGSGKSTLARALHDRTGIPLHHLDMMYWNADKTTVEKEVFLERLNAALAEEEWIIDGNYASTMALRIAACDTVIFLDYPLDMCLDGIRKRRGRPREDMPWTETGEDAEFIGFVKAYGEQQRPRVLALLQEYQNSKTVLIFRDRAQADELLESIVPSPREDRA